MKSLKKNIKQSASPERAQRLKRPSQFLNMILSNIIFKGKKKRAQACILDFLQISKLEKTPGVALLCNVFKRGVMRVALNQYVMGGKKSLVPNPASYSKLYATFIKEFVLIVSKRPEKLFSLKLLAELKDFIQKRGALFENRHEKYLVARRNSYLAKHVYRAKLTKSKESKNALEKTKFFYM